jgi:uncharacterized RDD family membrane protein YckC
MAAFVYEGVLLFGLTWAVAMAYSLATQQHHGLQGRQGMMAAQFLALAGYFLWAWTRAGQTLAMKTWQLRLVDADGRPVGVRRALLRFMLSWLWLMPPWLLAWLAGWHQSRLVFGMMLVWVLLYAALSRLLPQGHFLHDRISGTRIIDHRTNLPAP